MRLQDLALATARLAIANEKASEELSALLEKWFAKHLVKGIRLPMLRAMHDTGAFAAYFDCLATRDEADVIAVLRKVDPHRTDMLSRTRREIEAHIGELAAGRIDPAKKPKPANKPKAPKGAPGKRRNGGVYERSRI
jgi:hypothetical protein